MKTIDITEIKLSNRREYGEYITYTALSSDGHTEYTVTLRDGKAVGCTCPATVHNCRHARACEFEEEWTKPTTPGELVAYKQEQVAVAEQVAPLLVGELAQDLAEHMSDDLSVPLPERGSLTRERKVEVTPFGNVMLMR